MGKHCPCLNKTRAFMNKRKIVLLALGLAVWGASSFVMFKTTAPRDQVHAEGTGITTTATASGTQVNLSWNKLTDTAHYHIFRELSENGTFTQLASTSTGDITTYTDTPDNGSFIYRVDAQKTDSSTVTGFPTNAITVPSGGGTTTPPAAAPGGSTPTASSFLSGTCAQTVTAAQEAATKNPMTQGIYQTIDSKGVKEVFRWTLSLVNLLVLFFLLIIAFANILRIDVDTYSLQKVLVPLILGVLLANFGWLICRFFIEISTILYHALTNPFIPLDPHHTSGGAGLFSAIANNGFGFGGLCGTDGKFAGGIGVGSGLLGAFVGTALILVAGILILTLYVLLVARVWIVTLLIVLSPLAFLSLGFPMTQQYFKKWWSTFFNWVFMAPASFLILVLAYQMSNISRDPSLTKYILITALLYYAVQVPFKMGGEWMTKWGGYVSQFKKKAYEKTGQPIVARIGQSYQGYKDEYKTLAKTKLAGIPMGTRNADGTWRTFGQKLGEMKENTRIRRLGGTTALENAATGRGAASYVETEHGKRALRNLGAKTQGKQANEDTVKLGTQQGVVDFMDSTDPEAKRIRDRLGEIEVRQAANVAKLHHISEEGRKEFKQSPEGIALGIETAGLAREKTKLEEELKKLEAEASQAFETTVDATQLTTDIAQLQRENLNIEKNISNKQKSEEADFAASAAGQALTADLKGLGYGETEIDNLLAEAQASGEKEFFSRDLAPQLVERAVASGMSKEDAETKVKDMNNELQLEFLDNTRGQSALRKANFSVLESRDITAKARAGALTPAEEATIRSRLSLAGITGREATRVLADLAVDNDAGLRQNIALEKTKLDAKLTEADIEASGKTALGLAQEKEIENDYSVRRQKLRLEIAERTLAPAQAIHLLEEQLQVARKNAAQNSSIGRAAIIAAKDGLKETESANSLLFYAGETNGKYVLDRRTHWQGFIKTNETGVQNIENLAKQAYRSGDDPEKDAIAKRIGIDRDALDKEINRIDSTTVENIYTTKNAESETRKGKERVLGAIMNTQSYIEREASAKRREKLASDEFAKMQADLRAKTAAGTTITSGEGVIIKAKDNERRAAQAELTTRTREKDEYILTINRGGGPQPGDERSWENVGGDWKLKEMDKNDLDRLRAEYAVIQKERATNESNRSIDEKIAEYEGVGVDIHDTWVDEYDAAGKVTGSKIVTGKQFVQARLNGDHNLIAQVIHNGYAVKVDPTTGAKTKSRKRDTRFLFKTNGWIGGGLEKMGRYMDPEGQKLLPYFTTNIVPDETIKKVIQKFQESPRYQAIPDTGNTPAAVFKQALIAAGTDVQAQKKAFAGISDQALQKLYVGTIQELMGSIKDIS